MTDDTDDRMERAERIRQMRDGQRGDDPDGDADEPTSGTAEPDSGTAEPESDAADHGSETTDTESPADRSPTDGEDDSGAATEAAANAAGDDGSDAAAVADDTGDDGDGSHALDDEATAAAQRAAQAAAQVTGGTSAGGTDASTAEEVQAGGAPTGDAGGSATTGLSANAMQGPTGVELPDEETVQAAVADEVLGDQSSDAAVSARAADAQAATTNEDTVRVLEFTLGDEHYCLDISHVEEIVNRETITRVPNTPDYVEGVVDLRGQITTILDPKRLLDIDQEGVESLLVVFAPGEFEDQGAIGWVVDQVRQVVPIAESEVSAPPVDEEYIEGVVDRDDEFVIWIDPEIAIELATRDADD